MLELIKYFFLMILILILEMALAIGMFVFVSGSKLLFIIFSFLLIAVLTGYLVYSRYQERIKIKPIKEVRQTYLKNIAAVLVFLAVIFAVILFIRVIIMFFI